MQLRPLTTLRPSQRHAAAAFSSRASVRSMASKHIGEMVVKGDPATKTIGSCPFCQRVLLTTEIKGLTSNLMYIEFKNKPQWVIDAGGTVPIWRPTPEKMVVGSDVIVGILEKDFPEPSMKSDADPNLGDKLFPEFKAFLFSADGSAEETQHRAALEAELKHVNDNLVRVYSEPHHAAHALLFGGKTMNATDAAIAPKLYHITVALLHFKKWTLGPHLVVLSHYLAACKALEAWKKWDYGEPAIIAGWEDHMKHK